MKHQKASVTHMIAGAIAAVALTTETDGFSFRHSIIGIILVLFIVQGFRQSKTFYLSLFFSAIFALATLLALGKLIDFFLRDAVFFHLTLDRDFTYFCLWLFLTFLVLAFDHALEIRSGT